MPSSRTRLWVSRVKTDSTHPPSGPFTKKAPAIARALPSKKEGLSEGSRFGNADAHILHQSRRARSERYSPEPVQHDAERPQFDLNPEAYEGL
jgi:hypothetical protein